MKIKNMNQFFFRIIICVFGLFLQNAKAQIYQSGLSDAKLNINGSDVTVKVFTSTDLATFYSFAETKENQVIALVNDRIFEIGSEAKNNYNLSIIQNYQAHHFQFLDENFKPADVDVTVENAPKIKYLVKVPQKLTHNDKIDLKTRYKIWDPATGINIGPFKLHFYSLMFILAFGIGYIIMTHMFNIDQVNNKYLEPLFTYTLLGTIFGARLGHVIFYQPELFKEDFWSVFLPIRTQPEFEFTGFSGLASHGAAIALILTTLYYSYNIIKKNPMWVYDRIGIVVALAGFFIRIGNFFNSEIIGKPVNENSPFAVLFPQMSDEYGATVPRYPTQLFEAFGYLLLFCLLWVLYRYTRKKYQQGWLFGVFFLILWAIRFFVEFLKEPQGDEFISFAGLNTGQILSIPFMLIGLISILISPRFKISQEENKKPD